MELDAATDLQEGAILALDLARGYIHGYVHILIYLASKILYTRRLTRKPKAGVQQIFATRCIVAACVPAPCTSRVNRERGAAGGGQEDAHRNMNQLCRFDLAAQLLFATHSQHIRCPILHRTIECSSTIAPQRNV